MKSVLTFCYSEPPCYYSDTRDEADAVPLDDEAFTFDLEKPTRLTADFDDETYGTGNRDGTSTYVLQLATC